ncbi:MAG: hypothetical protein JWM96_1287 [Alphaproteobacteria bacterium]|nr:hypothetical protein [Alphaproteobacteria bacterium]
MTGKGWRFDNSYARLPAAFFAACPPVPVAAPRLVIFNHELAHSLGLDFDACSQEELAALFGGNVLAEGMMPIAQAYAGHQFAHFTMLGDGRAVLLGEHVTADSARVDIQLKGSGQTPFSRRGDGRAALGPMLREYIISEAMHGLGIPTTRSLAVTASGETIWREAPLPGAILTRIAASHIRVGTFEYAAGRMGPEGVRSLADYTLQRHYPELAGADQPYLALLQAVIDRQAALIAKWLLLGFVHGVMNTDNVAVSGETIDYGPCAFMDAYDPSTVFSSIDRQGRYAYARQPDIAQWNLARFAETLLPLLDSDSQKAVEIGRTAIEGFSEIFQTYWLSGMRAKLGLSTEEAEDKNLAEELLVLMQYAGADFTNLFRALSRGNLPVELARDETFSAWHRRWQIRLGRQPQGTDAHEIMRRHNPEIIPRNHRVEEALAAAEAGDIEPVHLLLDALRDPYATRGDRQGYLDPSVEKNMPYQTFCGT